MSWLIRHINDYIFAPLVPIVLVIVGFYVSAKLRFLYITKIKVIINTLFCSKKDKNGVSPIKAVSVALAGTLGVGNITGVAAAIISGGAGAVFWMWVGALMSMLIKYSEIVLAVKYRKLGKSGFYGGAMYYMSNRCVAGIFACLCVLASLSIGNFLQINACVESLTATLGGNSLAYGIIISVVVFAIIYRGINTISKTTVVLVPLMSIIYILISLYVIFDHICELPSILLYILKDAFKSSSLGGGIIGILTSKSIRFGITRGLVTNEAGCGTAPMAHASANTDSPVKQGFWGIFEVFADTIVMCSISAFVILFSIDKFPTLNGMSLVIACFSESIGAGSGYIITICIVFFAIATMLGWSYYGKCAIEYLFKNETLRNMYYIVYCIMIILGSVMTADMMWLLADFTVSSMTLINSSCVCMKMKEVCSETKNFFLKTKIADKVGDSKLSQKSSQF